VLHFIAQLFILSLSWPSLVRDHAWRTRSNSHRKPTHRTRHSHKLCVKYNKIDNTNLLVPAIKGDRLCIKIDQEECEKGINDCQRNLRGCLVLNKGYKPYTSRDLSMKLTKLWHTSRKWRLISLGRGYFEFQFDNYDDLCMVWAKGTVNLTLGVLRLSK